MSKVQIRQLYRIEGGILDGTELEPFWATMMVRYPHRKTPDLYVPPLKTGAKEIKTWHCCQENCSTPDFEGGMEALLKHLELHKGRLLRPWSKRRQLQTPLPAVKIPANEWKGEGNLNDDRRFVLDLYIEDLTRTLKKQGLEVLPQISVGNHTRRTRMAKEGE